MVIVTGPTVIMPLLRRVKVTHNLATVLEAEAVLIDPIGAILAIVALEFIVHPTGSGIASGLTGLFLALGIGILAGIVGGFLIGLLLRTKNFIPDGLENVLTLTSVLVLFHLSNYLQPESGIAAVAVAGIVVGNFPSRDLTELSDFKEQLTVMLIGMLFVILAADIRFDDLLALGMPGLWTVLALIFLIRPMNIAVGTIGSKMSLPEKAFLSWMAPRGIVAAAIASFFAIALDEAGLEGGRQLQAMVFVVIAATVVIQGLSCATVAKLLGVRRIAGEGFIILGANKLGRLMGQMLSRQNEPVLMIDSNSDAIAAAEQDKLKALFGNGLEFNTMQRARLDDKAGAIGLTTNEEVNLLFVSRARKQFKLSQSWAALHLNEGHVTPKMIAQAGSRVLFGVQRNLQLWSIRLERNLALTESWRSVESNNTPFADLPEAALLPMIVKHNDLPLPVDQETTLKAGDEVLFAIFEEERQTARQWFAKSGWVFEGAFTADAENEK